MDRHVSGINLIKLLARNLRDTFSECQFIPLELRLINVVNISGETAASHALDQQYCQQNAHLQSNNFAKVTT